MGLFKKRAEPGELERLKSEISAMATRLAASEQHEQHLGETVRGLVTRVGTPTGASTEPPLPPPSSIDPAEIDKLNAKIARLSVRLDESRPPGEPPPGAAPEDIERLHQRIEQLAASSPSIDPAHIEHLDQRITELAGAGRGADATEIAALRERLEQLAGRFDEVARADAATAADPADIARIDETLQRISDRIDEVDQRITSISTELANQLSELSTDLDGLDGTSSAPAEEAVGEIREAQTRLAEEQARYQIAFRQDLAELADRLKRS